MANRSLYQQQFTYARELVFVPIAINVNSTTVGTVDFGSGYKPATVTRTATGTYDIVFSDYFPKMISAIFNYQAGTAIDRVPQVVSFDPTTNKLTIRLLAGANPTDPGAVASVIRGLIIFSNVAGA